MISIVRYGDAYHKEKKELVSFSCGVVQFRKNIHEFIADGITKPPLIAALKHEDLYDRFVKESDHLFA
jgi:hypothetical protein